MAYQPYADTVTYYDEYEGEALPSDSASKYLLQASRDVDSLTFNRIVRAGFDSLTEYQQEIVRDVVCQHAEFLCENLEMMQSVFSSYSINGVSAQLGDSINIVRQSGVIMQRRIYALLSQTGLTCRLVR